ncbi:MULTISPECIES: hypothetical protein [Mycolicibacterium]|nr:hypothetical protein [Mycolicibacterium fortuitum]
MTLDKFGPQGDTRYLKVGLQTFNVIRPALKVGIAEDKSVANKGV